MDHIVHAVKVSTPGQPSCEQFHTDLKFVSSSGGWSDRYRLLRVAMMLAREDVKFQQTGVDSEVPRRELYGCSDEGLSGLLGEGRNRLEWCRAGASLVGDLKPGPCQRHRACSGINHLSGP